MKEFIKKRWSDILFAVAILVFFFVPGVREFIQRPFLLKPSLEKVEHYGKLSDRDYEVHLKGINVPDANLSDFKGKPIFLNFWGSWCPPCRTEFPTIQSLYEEKKGKIQFVLIAMQDQEQKVKDFMEKNGYTTPVYMIDQSVPSSLDFEVFPTTFIIGKDGEILKKDQGAADWNSPSVHDFIEKIN